MALLFVLAAPTAGAVEAATDCPCIAVSQLLPQTTAGCLETSCDSPLQLSDSQQCISPQYGSSTCTTHDQNLPECAAVASPPAHCAEPWCYVNHTRCRSGSQGYERSVYFPEIEDLFYSYATCRGSSRAFRSFQVMQEASAMNEITAVIPSSTLTLPLF